MEGKGSFIILLIIVAILTLTLAVLAGYLFIMGGASKPAEGTNAVQAQNIPKSSELSKKEVFGETPELFNLKPDDDGTLGILQLNSELVYYKKVKGIKNTDELLEANTSEIKEAITQYFLSKTYSDISQPDGLQKAKDELKKEFNSLFRKKEVISRDVIWDVVISKWNIQKQ